jgi:hypothetical protein
MEKGLFAEIEQRPNFLFQITAWNLKPKAFHQRIKWFIDTTVVTTGSSVLMLLTPLLNYHKYHIRGISFN